MDNTGWRFQPRRERVGDRFRRFGHRAIVHVDRCGNGDRFAELADGSEPEFRLARPRRREQGPDGETAKQPRVDDVAQFAAGAKNQL